MKRRILSLLLALTMALTLFPATALAAEDLLPKEVTLVEEGGQLTEHNSGSQEPDFQEDAVASVGEQTYTSLSDAVSNAADGAVVTLLQNVSSGVISFNKDITIDLAGHTWTGTDQDYVFQVAGDYDVTIRGGSISGTSAHLGQITAGNVTLEGCTITITDCLFCQGGTVQLTDTDLTVTASNAFGLQVNDGTVTVDKDSTVTANGTDRAIGIFVKGTDNNASPVVNVYGTIRSYGSAIQGNGEDRSYPEINISGAKIETTKLALYLPQPGAVTITDSTISGYAGIGMKSGTLNIVDSEVKGTANDAVLGDEHSSTNGIATDGSAIVIDSYVGYAGEVNVTISGNSIIQSSYSTAIREIGNTAGQTNVVTLNISGGQILGAAGKDAVLVRDVTKETVSITGGTFSSEVPDEYMPAGYACVADDNGKYVVGEAQNGAMVVKPETGDSGEVSATLDGIYKGEDTTIEDNTSGSSESGGDTGVAADTGAVTVDLTTDGASGTGSASLTVTKTAAESLAAAPSLTVQTDVGSVKLDSEALDKMGDAKGNVVISIVEDETSVASFAASYTVEVKSGTTDLLPEGQANGEITITIPCPESLKDETELFVYYIKNSIPYQRMNATKTDDGQITFTTNHLSQYAVYSAEPNTDYEATVTGAAGVSTPYETLAAAINAAKDGDTVTLQKEVNLTDTLSINTSHSFALDLNDKTLSGRVNLLKGNLTIKNGTVKHEKGQALNVYGSKSDQAKYSVLKIEEDVTIEAAYGICIFPEYEGSTPKLYGYGIIVDVEGKINQGGIFVSGNLGNSSESSNKLSQSNNVPVVNVRSGAVVNNTSPDQGIAMNGYAVVNVYEGANIKGNEAIGVKRGQLNIYGGTFQAIGEKVDPVEANNNGTEKTGATISVTSTYNYAGKIEINITGGTFTSTNSAAFYVGHSQASDQPTSYQQGLSIDLEGGTFISPNGQTAVYVADAIEGDKEDYTKEIVSGGSFSSSVFEYVIDSLNAELKKSTGATPYSYYTDVEEALEYASAGDEVTDLSDPAGEPEPITAATVTYDDGGHGTAPARHNVTVGEKITLRDMEDADGYAFMGWSMGGNTYQPGDTFTVTAARTTFTAVWELKATPIEPVTDVGYLVEHYLEGRWGYELVETEFFMDKIGTTVTDQDKDYPGYRCNWLSSTFSGTLVKPESDSDVVILKLYYDKWSPSPTDDSDDDRYQLPTWDVIVADSDNGSVEVFPEAAKPSTTITITATPDRGYAVADVTVTDENGSDLTVTAGSRNQYSFRMPNCEVTVEVTFQAASGGAAGSDLTITAPAGWVNPYTDVAVTAWYYDAVGYVSANGLMGGTSATTFAPEGSMNRSMVWTVIARLAGQTISGANWAEDARTWAVAQGVSDGTNPGGSVTREELVTMLYRYAGSPAMNVPELALIGSYPDSVSVSDWAQNAFAWALSQGIIDGRDGKLAAGESVTRAEAATILARFHLAV